MLDFYLPHRLWYRYRWGTEAVIDFPLEICVTASCCDAMCIFFSFPRLSSFRVRAYHSSSIAMHSVLSCNIFVHTWNFSTRKLSLRFLLRKNEMKWLANKGHIRRFSKFFKVLYLYTYIICLDQNYSILYSIKN